MQKFPLSEPDLLHFPYLSITFWWANQGKQMHIMNVSKSFRSLVSISEVEKTKLMLVSIKSVSKSTKGKGFGIAKSPPSLHVKSTKLQGDET